MKGNVMAQREAKIRPKLKKPPRRRQRQVAKTSFAEAAAKIWPAWDNRP